MESKKLEKAVKWIKKNWEKIPDKYKEPLKPNSYGSQEDIKGLKKEEHFVVLLIDRQKPSIEANYDFDEERFGVNREGKLIWGFDSGCSCPSPWKTNYPQCYSVSKTWKQFEVNLKKFDKEFEKEAIKKLKEIKKKVKE